MHTHTHIYIYIYIYIYMINIYISSNGFMRNGCLKTVYFSKL